MDSPVAIETCLSHLTPDSRELVSFIGRRNIKDSFRFTNTTRHTITKLCKMIHRSYMRIPHYSVQNILPNEMETFMSAFAKSETNHIPDSIFDSILSAEKIGRRIQLKIQQREVVIHLILHKNTEAMNSRSCSCYPRNATTGACSELRKDAGANNEQRWTSYPRNATTGACSELPKPASSHYSRIFASTELADIFFQNCALRMIAWLQVAMQFAEKKCTETLRCYMFLTPHTKILPKSCKTNCDMGACSGSRIRPKRFNNIVGEYDDEPSTHTPITQEHANTAFTWACVPHSEIVVFRMEEWFKVFIHETFHTLGLDFSEMDMTESNEQMSRIFGGCSPAVDFRIYESYSEVWAETINAIFVAYLRKDAGARNERRCTSYSRNATSGHALDLYSSVIGTQKRHKTRVIETAQPHVRRMRTMRASHTQSITSVRLGRILRRVELYLQNERAFSMFQMAKVLHHHQLTYSDLCTTPDIARSRRRKYTEETQVFSYYIIKTILLFHLNDFIEWCTSYSRNATSGACSEYGVSFKKTPENILEYVRLIERLHKMPEFVKRVGSETEYYSRNRSKLYPLLRTTMRMSLYESITCP